MVVGGCCVGGNNEKLIKILNKLQFDCDNINFLKIWSRGGAPEQNEQKPENSSRAPPSRSILMTYVLNDRNFFITSKSVYNVTY